MLRVTGLCAGLGQGLLGDQGSAGQGEGGGQCCLLGGRLGARIHLSDRSPHRSIQPVCALAAAFVSFIN